MEIDMLNVIVEIVLIAVIAIGMILGIKRGFIKTVAKPVKFVLTLVIAFSLSGTVANNIIEPVIAEPITTQMEEYVYEKCEDINSDNVEEKLPTILKISAGLFNIDLDEMSDGATTEELISRIISSLVSPAIHVVAVIISFILLYFLSSLCLALVIAVLNSFFDTGLIGVCNRVLGCVFSTAFAVIIAWCAVSVFTYVINVPALAETSAVQSFEGGFVYKFFNNLNPIDLLLSF